MKYLPSGTAANHDKVSIMGMITSETEQSNKWRNILDLVLKMFLPLPPENNILTKAPNFTFQQQGFPSLHLVVGYYFIFVFSFRSSDLRMCF